MCAGCESGDRHCHRELCLSCEVCAEESDRPTRPMRIAKEKEDEEDGS